MQLPPRKLLASAATKIRIAVASAIVLIVGAWLAPRAAQTTLSTPQEHAAPLLEEQAQRREASRSFVGVQEVAARVRDHSIAIPTSVPASTVSRNDFSEPESEATQVAGFAVFVTDTYLLAHSAALDGRSVVRLPSVEGASIEARVVVYDPPTGLVLLQTAPTARIPVTFTTETPAPGTLAVGVGRAHGRDTAVPVFVTSAGDGRYTIGAVNESILPGLPVFTLDGELFAIAAPDGDEVRAVPARAAATRLIARASAGERRSSFGLGFQSPQGALAKVFGEQGVVVTDVVEGGPADVAEIQAGDVLLAVDAEEIDSVETASRLLGGSDIGAVARLRVRRSQRTREVEATPATAYEVATLARGSAGGPSGPEARAVFSPALLQRAAIAPAARVLAVNGRPVVSRAQVQREMRAARRPVPVLIGQGRTRFFVAIEPAS